MTSTYIIGTVGVPACYGGFESLVQNLVDYQSKNINYHVFCSVGSYKEKKNKYKDALLTYLPIKANGISSILYDILSLVICIRKKPDVTLILGVSGCIFLPLYRLFSSSRIVTNIDGLEWRREKWGGMTKRFLKFSERLAVRFSDVVISDNQAIADYVSSEYGVNSEVIAYGGDHVMTIDHSAPVVKKDYYLSLCRIEPENNVEMILSAFAKSGEKLKFIGNWDASVYGRDLKRRYSECKNIDIIAPIYDISTLFKIRSSCKAYVHGHSAGGTNPSLVEAMQFGMPIYAFDCTFNRYTTNNSAFYFSDVESLRRSLSIDNSSMSRVGAEMKRIALEYYQWQIIVDRYESIFLSDDS